MKATWKCPHCGHENTKIISEDNYKPYAKHDIEYCDSCEEMVVVEFGLVVTSYVTPINVKQF